MTEPQPALPLALRLAVSIVLGVPSMYALLLRLPQELTADLHGLRLCVSGGAAMRLELMQRFEARFGVPVLEGDGPTECSPVTCVNPPQGPRRPGSVGLPVPGVQMRIVDDPGRPLARGAVGELVVSGPNVMQGHWGRPEDTRAAFCEDWFRTGDLGYQDEDGYFCIVDRKKDLIIVNGMNVYPRMIEEILHRHPAVAEVAVVGDPDPVHGEVPVAHVVLRQPGAAGAAELRRHCQADLGRHEVPRRFHFLSELPRTATGKVLKRTLRRGAEIERGVPPRPRVRERHRRSGVEIRRLLHATGGADERESGDDGAPAARSRGA